MGAVFGMLAGFYFWLQYEFIAAVQIVVYVGGIVVLIIFSIFLTQQAGEKMPQQKLTSLSLVKMATTEPYPFMQPPNLYCLMMLQLLVLNIFVASLQQHRQ